MNGKLNIKEIKRDFESCIRDSRNQLIEFGKLITTYEQLPWATDNQLEIQKYNGIKDAMFNLIQEARAKIVHVETTFTGLVSQWNNKAIKPIDFNFEVIALTQQIFQHQEYLALDGLTQLQEGIYTKIRYIEEYKKKVAEQQNTTQQETN